MDKKNKSKLKNLVNKLRLHTLKMGIKEVYSYNYHAFKEIIGIIKSIIDSNNDSSNISFDYDDFISFLNTIDMLHYKISDSKDENKYKEYLMRMVWKISEFERLNGLFE